MQRSWRLSLKLLSIKPEVEERSVKYVVALGPHSVWKLDILFEPVFMEEGEGMPVGELEEVPGRMTKAIGVVPTIDTDYDDLQHAYEQSVKDMISLQLKGKVVSKGDVIPAAGIPWYLTVFGRDSLITGYQTMPFMPELSKGVLRTLVKYQGREENALTGEQPGRILHELRFGPLVETGKVPARFYSAVDATILYLILFSEYYRWSGDIETVKELLGPAEKALAWIDRYGDLDGDGFVEYTWMTGRELAAGGPIEYTWSSELGRYNQGWKDSWNSLSFADGRLPDPPIALCEPQGYIFDAKMRMSELYSVLGDHERAKSLKDEALDLQQKFENAFWMDRKGFYAAALDGNKRHIDSCVSNQGHLLWSGIVSEERARAVAERLCRDDMLSGWGIRTMSTKDAAYNPMSYHNGSIWPHDNSIIMAGFLRYGFVERAWELVKQLNSAIQHFPKRTPPELFCGFSRDESPIPVAYSITNSPQAWASGAVHLMLRTMLCLEPDAADKEVGMDPWLIPGTNYLKVDKLPVAGSRISFQIQRVDDKFNVEILENPSNLKIIDHRGRWL